MAQTGRCLCGGIQFEVNGDPMMMGTCHCTRCQKRTGGPGVTAIAYPLGAVSYTQGEELITVYNIDEENTRRFCSQCGCPMPGQGEKFAIVQAGLLDGDPGIRPQFHMMMDFKADWDEVHDTLPQFGEYPPMDG